MHRAARRGFRSFTVRNASEVAEASGAEYFVRGPSSLEPIGSKKTAPIPVIRVGSPEDLRQAVRIGGARGAVAVEWTGDRIIPLENLLAEAKGQFRVWAFVRNASDLPTMLGALERGADRLIVEVASLESLDTLEALLEEPPSQAIPWELATLSRVEPAGLGDRVIVDTTSILGPEEGLLVGSAAAFLFHVASEAVGSRFSRPRPFRVNAGAAHSYTMLSDGTTRYLSELVAGDAVLVAVPHRKARAVRVGRVKIERRPLVMVETERESGKFTVFLQDAETVRLTGESERIATPHLAPGMRVVGAGFPAARHLGTVIDESIVER